MQIDLTIQSVFGVLKRLYGYRHLLNQAIKIKLCDTLILSMFNCGDVIHDPSLTDHIISKIQKIQNCCLKFIYGII